MKTLRALASPLFAIILLAAASIGCVGVSYQRQSFAPDGKPLETVKARATSIFTAKSFDTLNASVASPNDQRALSVGRYQSTPDAKSIEAVGTAGGKFVQP